MISHNLSICRYGNIAKYTHKRYIKLECIGANDFDDHKIETEFLKHLEVIYRKLIIRFKLIWSQTSIKVLFVVENIKFNLKYFSTSIWGIFKIFVGKT